MCTYLETPKLRIRHVSGLEDFRWFNSFSRLYSKWPLSRPKLLPEHLRRSGFGTHFGNCGTNIENQYRGFDPPYSGPPGLSQETTEYQSPWVVLLLTKTITAAFAPISCYAPSNTESVDLWVMMKCVKSHAFCCAAARVPPSPAARSCTSLPKNIHTWLHDFCDVRAPFS